jgi:uncharacterized protein (TIGR02145 family)
MHKTRINLLFLLLLPLFFQCKNEDDDYFVPIVVASKIIDVSFFDGSDGSINLTVTGGFPPYRHFWSNNATSEDLKNLKAGKYISVITDSRYQVRTDTFEVLQPEPDALIFVFDVQYPTTKNGSNGSINLTVNGGYPPYSLLWSNGVKTNKISNLSPAVYTVTVSDSKSQIKTDTVLLNNFIIDAEGNCYTTVQIGTQTWMQQNLRVTRNSTGKLIESHIYNNDTTFLKKYGRLYSWDVLMNGSTEEKTRGICPEGWHVPSDDEFKILEKALGMSNEELNLSNTWRGADIGTKLKSGGIYGFNIQLSGRRLDDGSFSYIDRVEYLWTSSTSGQEKAWRRSLDNTRNDVGRFDSSPKTYGFSVRCIKND